ncbi:zinc ribbon domain-containing protein [uncultured Ruminococcus sp.]|uniref:zinc ribbon domain-containing protein n=1 Tax=uncultured Ruminococcus sp. TaxID=165186 RepID=UPI0025CF5685|nr:zinc ribbon domain-containing protein [uncultured Ruminococcus sp.]
MFCKHCGTQIPDGSETCPSCGGALTNSAAPAGASQAANNANAGAAVKELADTFTGIAVEKTAGLPLALIAKVCVLIALVAFFLPFISVSCTQDKSVKESYSGFRLMLSIEKKDDSVASNSESDPKPNVFLIAAFAGGAAAAVIIFRKKNIKLAAIISGISALVLILFRMTFRSYYDFPSEYAKYIKVKTKFGLLLCILMMLATAAACFLESKNAQKTVGTSEPPALPPADQPPAEL